MCSVLYTLLCYYCILWAMYVLIIGNDSLYPDRCPCSIPPCDYSSRWDTVTRGTRFRHKRTLDGNQPPLPSARPWCCIWGLVTVHGPPVVLPICLCACISAHLFGLPRVLGTEGLSVTRGNLCGPCKETTAGMLWERTRIPSWQAVESRLSYIQPGLDYRLAESSSS